MIKRLAAVVLMGTAVAANAAPTTQVQGLVLGNETARYVKGVPTLDLQQQGGAVQVRFWGWDHSNAVFAVGFFNGGSEPVNVGIENLHASANGKPLRIFSVDELSRQAKNRATWRQIGLAFFGGVGAALAANQRSSYHGSYSGPYGRYSFTGSYPSLAGQLQANQISRDTAMGLSAIRYQLDATIGAIGDRVIQTTTVDPQTAFGGLIVVEKVDMGTSPLEFRLDADFNGERYPFGYLLLKKGQPVPAEFEARLASKAKPRVIERATVSTAAAEHSSPVNVRSDPGAIYLRSGAVKIPAKTPSGYCLNVPPGYVATGAIDTPIINGALPRCSSLQQK